MQSLALTSQLTSVSPSEVVCPLIDARGNVFRSARDIRAPEVAKVTKLNPPSAIPDLHNSVISFSAFQSELDEWHFIRKFGTNINTPHIFPSSLCPLALWLHEVMTTGSAPPPPPSSVVRTFESFPVRKMAPLAASTSGTAHHRNNTFFNKCIQCTITAATELDWYLWTVGVFC